jgi:hypothetical protein
MISFIFGAVVGACVVIVLVLVNDTAYRWLDRARQWLSFRV